MNDEQDNLLKTSDAQGDRSQAIDKAAECASELSVQGNEHAESDGEKNAGRFSAPGKERTKPDAEEAVSGDAETSCTDVGTVSSRTGAVHAGPRAMGQAAPRRNDGSQPKRRAVDLPYERRRQVVAWAFVAAWAGFIFWASAHTGMQLDYGNDLLARAKAWLSSEAFQVFGYTGDISPVGHFCEYFVFGLLVARATAFGASERWRTEDHLVRWRAIAMTAGVTALYALSDEIHQLFVPNRSCDPADWAVDMVAATVSSLIAVAVVRRGQRKRQASRTRQP